MAKVVRYSLSIFKKLRATVYVCGDGWDLAKQRKQGAKWIRKTYTVGHKLLTSQLRTCARLLAERYSDSFA